MDVALLTLAFTVNAVVVIIVPALIIVDAPSMRAVYGKDTPARRILACLYFTIALASIVGLVLLHLAGRADAAIALARVLFPLQIAYKLMTWPAVGLRNPVVVSNLAIAAVLAAALAAIGE